MEPLTKKQYETLEFIKAYKAHHGFMPIQKEIAANFNIAMGGAINARIKQLIKKGYLTATGSARGLTIIENE
jgi:SOS-response transcriptional repressor LexA